MSLVIGWAKGVVLGHCKRDVSEVTVIEVAIFGLSARTTEEHRCEGFLSF